VANEQFCTEDEIKYKERREKPSGGYKNGKSYIVKK
jgi:hypothetical protein